MKVEMTNEEMRKAIEVLSTAREKGKLGYAIARNTRKLKDAAKEYLDMREKLIREHGDKDEKGNITVSEKKWAKCQEEMEDIMGISHEADLFAVSSDDFMSGTLNSWQMERLLWMVKEE